MKIIDKLHKAEAEGECTWSLEFFPPKTPAGIQNLYDRLERMSNLRPEFIDVTWAAGGSSSEATLDICNVAQTVYGFETCMHLTCTNMPLSKVDEALARAREIGIQNILALRGDPPRGQDRWTAVEGGLHYAADLVRYIRQTHGDWFSIAVAGYPEGHIENPDRDADLLHLKAKVDAGADFIVTQMFYDVDLFLDWVRRCRAIGITCPILPGIMPIQTFAGFRRMIDMSKTAVPQAIHDALEPIKDDDQAVKDYGVRLAIDMCRRIMTGGIRTFHIYTMNLERSVRLILEGLEFVTPASIASSTAADVARPLPWNPSQAKKRAGETVRPIFWRNRIASYVARTETWDDFPNGRWGDSRSPAYGDISVHGIALQPAVEDALRVWGHPATPAAVRELFVGYCAGTVRALPWSDSPLAAESKLIRDQLAGANARGFLTINSQPPVDAAPSSHPVYGWGPRHGWVWQKAYLEFFASPATLAALVNTLRAADPDAVVTFHAVNRAGDDLRTNVASTAAANAVTWGVFPGKEVVQPTIVDAASFMAWKDEAFALWDTWRSVVAPEDAAAASLLHAIPDSWFLVNLVHNDFRAPADELFALLRRAAAAAEGIPEDASVEEALAVVREREREADPSAVLMALDKAGVAPVADVVAAAVSTAVPLAAERSVAAAQ
ncbi:methylenetetrahydrofolate reductase (NAD(P)H) met13 [Blastocladiella emersonii ATCC 22665]|nr:methylenetetrahydrofolate reductase (NAD(P)H) met13 [Blastocladiella emersonii ATCC 22665]